MVVVRTGLMQPIALSVQNGFFAQASSHICYKIMAPVATIGLELGTVFVTSHTNLDHYLALVMIVFT